MKDKYLSTAHTWQGHNLWVLFSAKQISNNLKNRKSYNATVLLSFFILKVYLYTFIVQALSFQCGILIFIPLCFFLSVCFLFWNGNCRGLGTTLLGILPDGYSVWIKAKFQPRLECVCWTAHCISGDHTGSISMSKSLYCPLSLSEHLPQGSGS